MAGKKMTKKEFASFRTCYEENHGRKMTSYEVWYYRNGKWYGDWWIGPKRKRKK